MDKRYQVFVSSTYTDLVDERAQLIQTLMELDCIPAGMELFPAFDEEQFEFIKRVIDDCDYYVLMIGGRYGSTTAEGLSFTEKEYDYAVGKGLKVIALLHESPESIPVGKTERDPALQRRLEIFKEKVKTGRLVKFWKNVDQLPGILSLSLAKTIRTYPAVGWVRGNSTTSIQALEEINDLRKENEALKHKLASLNQNKFSEIANLASLDVAYQVRVTYTARMGDTKQYWAAQLTFGEYFAFLGPHIMENLADSAIKSLFPKLLINASGLRASWTMIRDEDYQTLKLQLKALGLIDLKALPMPDGQTLLTWSLTDKGLNTLMELKVVRES